ncbi:hypothetical protein QJS10_CPA06g01671 [Acorus calamus]|uniref:Uncharacterized protein n=1 Tax=Acorus calamus TaxID=4465 RepID=A0AAV9EHX6_ACOCL|nr:hypothetical protein QJS10_CPA06g01671 [Acorus calamus]
MKPFRWPGSGRLSVLKLRARFFGLIACFGRWKLSCDQALESLERKRYRSTTTTTGVERGFGTERSRVCRTNSFQDEAISDCLEFIKRTSISIDDGSMDGRGRD